LAYDGHLAYGGLVQFVKNTEAHEIWFCTKTHKALTL